MIDERTLTDATRCPSCSGPLGSQSCPTCGIDLRGPNARALWQVSMQAASLLAERTRLIAALRGEASTHAAPSAVPPSPAPIPLTAMPLTAMPVTAMPVTAMPLTPMPLARPAPEWTRRKVQNLLLSLGVGLLAVAAVIFLVVSWSVLGIGGRAAVMAGCTALAGGGAALASRRGLGSTAEAVSLLTVALGLLDAVGARGAGLAGLDEVDGLAYWAGAFAILTVLAAATAVVVPTRSLRIAAAVVAQLPVPLLTAHLADCSGHPAAVTAAGFTLAATAAVGVTAVAAIGVTAGWATSPRLRDARGVVAGGAGLAWLVACAAALVAAYGEAGSLVPGTALLVILAGLAASALLVGDRVPVLATAGVTAAAVLVLAAAWSVPVDQVDGRWLPVVLSAVALALLAAAVVVPRVHRTATAVVALVAAIGPGLVAVAPAAAVVLGQLGWLDRPWTKLSTDSARELLAVGGRALSRGEGSVLGGSLTWGTEIPLLLACVAVALAVAERLAGLRHVSVAAVPLAAVAVATLPVALDAAFRLALGVDLAVAAVLVLSGAWLLARGQVARGQVAWGATAAATGLVGLGLAVSWSFALQSATLAALPTAGVVLASAGLLLGDRRSVAALRLGLGVAAALAAVAEAAAAARAAGAGWPAVWSLSLGLAVVAATVAAVLLSGDVRRGFVATATLSLLGEAAALAVWGGGSAASAGLAMTGTAGALAATAIWLDTLLAAPAPSAPMPPALGQDVAITATLGAVVGVALSALDPDRLWLALLAAGLAAAVVSLRAELHRVGWAAAALLAASSWVRLVLSHVDAPEPYTVPAGVALIAFGVWRRRREPAYSSWRAYGTGLGLAMGPSLFRAVSDPGNLRPLLLGLAALVVLCSGIARRQKAPLVLGGTVLAVDVLVQLSPYLVQFYAAVPRWSFIAAAGLLLLTLGMTYEQRARELRALQHQISRFS